MGRETDHKHSWIGLAFGALGVVYGDIGTSPLYTFHECLATSHGLPVDRVVIFGTLSLIFWALSIVVSLKYVGLLLRFDNHGEGGIMALLALVPRRLEAIPVVFSVTTLLALAGASLLYGDAVITPAISMLGAIEGLAVAHESFRPLVVPLTVAVLTIFFVLQSRGTGRLGRYFGPIMLVWFVTIGGLGLYHLALSPHVLAALSPMAAFELFHSYPLAAFRLLGGVVLAVTGAEALYADMGHFGRRPIRFAWYALAYPALVLNYFGQGAILLAEPTAIENPFYAMVPPGAALYFVTGLATAAAVIASQGIITGVFSLTYQAIQLGYFPRLTLLHTSRAFEGRIYIPLVNWGLAISCITLVLIFRESTSLAGAYGLAVSGTMLLTSFLFHSVVRTYEPWASRRLLKHASTALFIFFVCIDSAFFGANALKFFEGGYLSIVIAATVLATMLVWRYGRRLLAEYYSAKSEPLSRLISDLHTGKVIRTPGTAVFMASLASVVPPALTTVTRRFGSLRKTVFLVTVVIEPTSHVKSTERFKLSEVGEGIFRLVVRYGYMQTPNVPAKLQQAAEAAGMRDHLHDVEYFLGTENFAVVRYRGLQRVIAEFFAFLSRNARNPTDYFRLPAERVIHIGSQIDLLGTRDLSH